MGFFAKLFGKKSTELPAPMGEVITVQKDMKLLPAPASPVPSAPRPEQTSKPVAAPKPAPKPPPNAPRDAAGPDLADDVLSALDRALSGGAAPAGSDAPDDARAEAEELFANIAATYADPVRGLGREAKRGTLGRTWLDVARPALRSVEQAARSMGLGPAAEKMRALDETLAEAEASREPTVPEALLREISRRYDELARAMPLAFALDGDPGKSRDGVIIDALLAQLPEVGRVTLQKLYAAGLTTLEPLARAKAAELSAATGIPVRIAEQIIHKVKGYQEELRQKSSIDLAAYRDRLRRLVDGLRATHEAFERSDGEEKRKARTARSNFLFQLSIVLAELGEVDYVKALEKLPFDKRVHSLEDYLARLGGR